jgi:hypothetical protein
MRGEPPHSPGEAIPEALMGVALRILSFEVSAKQPDDMRIIHNY